VLAFAGRQFRSADDAPWAEVASGTTNNIWRYSEARGVVAFLLFLLPKPSDEAEQRQQMVPRAHSVAECRTAQPPTRCLAFYALQLELDPFAKVTAVTEAGCEKFPRFPRSRHTILRRASPAWVPRCTRPLKSSEWPRSSRSK
jgi:hypothetical protein